MSIVRLTDQQVKERTVRTDDRADLEDLARTINDRTLYSVHLFDIDGGVRIHVINGSMATVMNEPVPLPGNSDDMFTVASKRKFIRMVKQELRKLLKPEGRPAA